MERVLSLSEDRLELDSEHTLNICIGKSRDESKFVIDGKFADNIWNCIAILRFVIYDICCFEQWCETMKADLHHCQRLLLVEMLLEFRRPYSHDILVVHDHKHVIKTVVGCFRYNGQNLCCNLCHDSSI